MKEVILIASGDLRLSANQKCEEPQAETETLIVVGSAGVSVGLSSFTF